MIERYAPIVFGPMTCRLVAVDLAPGVQFVELLQRIWDNGDAVLPIDQRLPDQAKFQLLELMAPAAIVTAQGEQTRDGGIPCLPGDALVVPTSGTTGLPKGVVLTHSAVKASALATSQRIGIDPSRHHWLSCLPLAHIGGLSVVTRALHTSTPLTVLPSFDAQLVDDAPSHGATHTSLVVSALQRIDPSRWECVVVGGSAMPPNLPSNTLRTYGMTETGSGVVYNGLALEGVQVRVVNGCLELQGPMLFRTYRQRNAQGFLTPEGTDPFTSDGWFATGDEGELSIDGVISVFGRVGDVIVTGGEKVWPDAVERVLLSSPQVLEVAVAGRPDAQWGSRVVAWVVPADPANPPTLDSLRTHSKESLPAYAAPQQINLCRTLPKTPTGKIQRTRLPD
jgi:o-succinylbenzoate---CoA ligase